MYHLPLKNLLTSTILLIVLSYRVYTVNALHVLPVQNNSYSLNGEKKKMLYLSTITRSHSDENIKSIITNEDEDKRYETSLASSYLIYIPSQLDSPNARDNNTSQNEITWILKPIDQVIAHPTNTIKNNEVGTLAVKALQSTYNDDDFDHQESNKIIMLHSKFSIGMDDCKTLHIQSSVENFNNDDNSSNNSNNNYDKSQQIENLIQVISRVMIQCLIRNKVITSLRRDPSKNSDSSLSSYKAKITIEKVEVGTFNLNDVISSTGFIPLYSLLLPPSMQDLSSSSIEMSEMVDSSDNVLGYVPRIFIHRYNILHRGIGAVICNQRHITYESMHSASTTTTTKMPEIYVHQRTATKRIFPSLYDMFVGGVSTAGESSILTTAREVAEELGLKKALHILEQQDDDAATTVTTESNDSPISDELFKCIVCTSYNRCLVTVYTYCYNKVEEGELTWQPEEVAWGDFVPYETVEKSASLSIQRLKERKEWPGSGTYISTIRSNHEKVKDEVNTKFDDYHEEEDQETRTLDNDSEYPWKLWDYVPDGLLVWEAWLQWMETGRSV